MEQGSGRTALLLLVVVILAACALLYDGDLNRQAPGFSLPETYGGRVGSDSYRGRPVLLVFWTTSCGICRSELPRLSQLAPEFRGRGIDVVTIHLGDGGDAREFLRSNRVALTALVDAEGTVGQAYHVSGVPKMVLVGADGKIKRTKMGMAGEAELREWMETVGHS